MLPAIMAILQIAKNKAQSEQNDINNLNNNMVQYNGQQPQQRQMTPMQSNSNGLGNALGTFSSIFGGLFNK